MEELSSCRFVAAPRGNGLDTHRLWEALYVGSYPIVKTSSLDSLYADLPVVIIRDWSEVTEEFLQKKYKELQQKSFSWDKLYLSYWIAMRKTIVSTEGIQCKLLEKKKMKEKKQRAQILRAIIFKALCEKWREERKSEKYLHEKSILVVSRK